MRKIKITINNNRAQVDLRASHNPTVEDIREAMKFKHPNAFYIRPHMPRGWDGKMPFMTDKGSFFIGYLPWFIQLAKSKNAEVTIEDYRNDLPTKIKIPKKVGTNTLRPYQREAVEALLTNKVGGVLFPIGGISAATNAGKTTMMAAIHLAVGKRSIMLLNDSDLFNQFQKELPELLPGEDIAFVQGAKTLEGLKANFVVAMVKTLSTNIKSIHQELAGFQVCLVDEYDLADNKTYKTVLERLYNTSVRCGLSGTAFMGKLKKHEFKHLNLKKFFSETVYTITKMDLVKKGVSTRLVIRFVAGNTKDFKGPYKDWMDVYSQLIVNNKERTEEVGNRIENAVKRKRIPALVVCRFKEHVLNIYNSLSERFPELRIDWVHSDKTNRKDVIQKFRNNEIDVLVGSYILSRGKNFPYIRYILNASGSDSPETISQIMGRGERKHESKNRTYIEDFYDKGKHVERHSKHRINYYREQEFRVLLKHKARKK